MLNRQQPLGADVITRISATMLDPDGARAPVGPGARDARRAGRARSASAAGSTPPRSTRSRWPATRRWRSWRWGSTPSRSAWRRSSWRARAARRCAPRDLGVPVHPRAPATVLPALGAYVGGDIVAGLLASGLRRDGRLRLFIDVGTNCEIALGARDRLRRHRRARRAGLRGRADPLRHARAPGAIETVRIARRRARARRDRRRRARRPVRLGARRRGRRARPRRPARRLGAALDREEAARAVARASPTRLVERAASASSCCTGPARRAAPSGGVFLGQRDVRELQFAKAAIATGWRCCCEELGVARADIQQVLLAGSLRLLPLARQRRAHRPRARAAGDAHRLRRQRRRRGREDGAALGAGARRAHAVLEQIEYVELSGRSDFNDRFVDRAGLPRLTRRRRLRRARRARRARSAERRGWDVALYPLPPQLHNRAASASPREVDALLGELRGRHERLAVAYADCGTYGVLDAVAGAARRRASARPALLRRARPAPRSRAAARGGAGHLPADRLPGAHASTRWSWRPLGLDRQPELRDDYFAHYRRVVWLAQRPTPELARAAERGRPHARPAARDDRGRRGRARGRARSCWWRPHEAPRRRRRRSAPASSAVRSPTTWPRPACATWWCSTRARSSTPAAPRSTRPASSSRPTPRACCARSRSARSTLYRELDSPERRTWLERRQPRGRGRAERACASCTAAATTPRPYGLRRRGRRRRTAPPTLRAAARPGGDPRGLPRADATASARRPWSATCCASAPRPRARSFHGLTPRHRRRHARRARARRRDGRGPIATSHGRSSAAASGAPSCSA